MRTHIYFYSSLLVFLLLTLSEAINVNSTITMDLKLRIVMFDNKPYGNLSVTVAYNTYYLINQRSGYCWFNVTDIEGYSEFRNITAQACVRGYCIAIKIGIPVYNLDFIIENIPVHPPHTYLNIMLPFIDVRSKDILVMDETNNPLNGTFTIYYKNTILLQGVFINGNLSLRSSPYPILSYTGISEIRVEDVDEGIIYSRNIPLFVEPTYRFELVVEELDKPYVEELSSSKLARLNKLIIRIGKSNVSGSGIWTNTTNTYSTVETSSTDRSWFAPVGSSDEKSDFNELLLVGPVISITLLVYEVLVKKRIG
ncbi:MAG: hypothetical protein QXX26_03875 [Desulfurococcaceae archaeon]